MRYTWGKNLSLMYIDLAGEKITNFYVLHNVRACDDLCNSECFLYTQTSQGWMRFSS